MNATNRAIAIVASVIIIVACGIFALVQIHPGGVKLSGNVDSTQTEALKSGDDLAIDSSISGVTVTADPSATGVTAHLYGTSIGINLGSEPQLEIIRNGSTVSVRAGRNWFGHLGLSTSMKLDIVVPAGFAGGFDCQSSAGPVNINCDFTLKSLHAHSSAGPVRIANVKASGPVEVDSSAGDVNTGAIEAASANIHSSAGRVSVKACTAGSIRLDSSAGGVTGDALSGRVDASSSAGSVDVTLKDVVDSANITSSAGSVHVTIPANANADIQASSSAGSVNVNNLDLTIKTKKNDVVEGTLGQGGPRVTAHSSAGSVQISGVQPS